MANGGIDSLVYAAELSEDNGNWRRAYGLWKELIARYGSYVSSEQLEYWENHRDKCEEYMMRQ